MWMFGILRKSKISLNAVLIIIIFIQLIDRFREKSAPPSTLMNTLCAPRFKQTMVYQVTGLIHIVPTYADLKFKEDIDRFREECPTPTLMNTVCANRFTTQHSLEKKIIYTLNCPYFILKISIQPYISIVCQVRLSSLVKYVIRAEKEYYVIHKFNIW